MKRNIIITIFLILIFLVLNVTQVQAIKDSESGRQDIDIHDVTGGASDFISAGQQLDTPLDNAGVKNVSDIIYNILLILGVVATVIVGLIIGIKIVLGSNTEKAETKQLIIPYIIGCVVIFGAFIIWKMVVEILNQTA